MAVKRYAALSLFGVTGRITLFMLHYAQIAASVNGVASSKRYSAVLKSSPVWYDAVASSP